MKNNEVIDRGIIDAWGSTLNPKKAHKPAKHHPWRTGSHQRVKKIKEDL